MNNWNVAQYAVLVHDGSGVGLKRESWCTSSPMRIYGRHDDHQADRAARYPAPVFRLNRTSKISMRLRSRISNSKTISRTAGDWDSVAV